MFHDFCSVLFSFDDLLVDSSDEEVEETKFKKKVNKCICTCGAEPSPQVWLENNNYYG